MFTVNTHNKENDNSQFWQNKIIAKIYSMEVEDLKYLDKLINNFEDYKYVERMLIKIADDYYREIQT